MKPKIKLSDFLKKSGREDLSESIFVIGMISPVSVTIIHKLVSKEGLNLKELEGFNELKKADYRDMLSELGY